MINNRNDRSRDTEHIIQAGNWACYKYKYMKSKEMSRKTKMRVYRVAIRPAVSYGAKTMILTKGKEEKLRRFERKIVRKIYGPKKAVKGISKH